jgi:uncharacterized protein (TIGR00299 family) protein
MMAKREKILYFDCFSGISGDMTLGAFIDLGMPEGLLRSELGKLGLDGWELHVTRASRKGIAGTKVNVELVDGGRGHSSHQHDGGGDHQHCDDACHGHDHGNGPHQHAEDHDHDQEDCHRSYRDIKAIIEGSALHAGTKERALSIFARLAAAEAKVHDMAIEDVEFHEVGAIDSIIDIVGAAACIEYFSPDHILCSRIELGGGFVKCQHGLLPVPAPAVVELLAGAPVKSGLVQMETTTPTGAAILAASVDEFTDDRRFTIARGSYGIGHRDPETPNVLRLFLGEGEARPVPAGGIAPQTGVVLECNVDDMSPELQGYLFERFLKAGASDVWLTPIVMKKSRPAVTISVLCDPELEAAISRLLVEETSTFGFRRYAVDKFALDRRMETVETMLGPVRVKSALFQGSEIKSKPEYEDLKRIAEERSMPLRLVQEQVLLELGSTGKTGALS